jgi:hypothetical protein
MVKPKKEWLFFKGFSPKIPYYVAIDVFWVFFDNLTLFQGDI